MRKLFFKLKIFFKKIFSPIYWGFKLRSVRGDGTSKPLKLAASIALSLMLGGVVCVSGGFLAETSSGYVYVDELWDSSTNSFNKENLSTFLNYFGESYSSLDSYAFNYMNANTIRSTVGSDVVVRLGGLDWTVVYASPDDDGNKIITLYLSSSYQRAFSGRSQTEGEYYGFLNGALYSRWTPNFSTDAWASVNPSNVYGLSYLRAVALNNGGKYASTATETYYSEVSPSSSSVFAPFTISTPGEFNDLTDYIVPPSKISWQKDQNSVNCNVNSTYTNTNDSAAPVTSPTWYSHAGMMAAHSLYYNWANDKLWIPSLAELGYNDTYYGIWRLSEAQREFGDGKSTSSSILGNVGSTTSNAYNCAFTRSGRTTTSQCFWGLYPSGTNYTYFNVVNGFVVRPALHLNLTAAIQPYLAERVDELWDEENKKFDSTNLDTFLGHFESSLTDTTNIDEIASEGINAERIRSYTNSDGVDMVVRLGGLDWHVTYLTKDSKGNTIATLWLSSDKQELFEARGSSEGDYYGFSDGALFSLWAANLKNTYVQIENPTSVYGTSYIRAVTLNNGGEYVSYESGTTSTATTQLSTAVQSSSSVFAPFTMSVDGENDLSDFIVAPKDVGYQAGQNYINYTTSTSARTSLNESTTPLTDAKYANTAASNIESKYNYFAWINDKLWLPSKTEVGYSVSVGDSIWDVTYYQAKFRNGGGYTNDELIGKIEENVYSDYPRARSAHYYSPGYYPTAMSPDGNGNSGNWGLTGMLPVRPALHLNLTEAVKSTETRDFKVTYAGANAQDEGDLELYWDEGIYVGDCGGAISVGATETFSTDYSTKQIRFTIMSTQGDKHGYEKYLLNIGSAPTLTDYDGEGYIDYVWTPTESVELMVYMGQRYTITYDANGGSGTLTTKTAYKMHGASFLIEQDNTLTLEDCFEANGWNTKADGSGTAYAWLDNYNSNADVTLYAQWKPLFCTVLMEIMTFSESEGAFVKSTIGGTISYSYTTSSGTTKRMVSGSADTETARIDDLLLKYDMIFSGNPTDGYVFLGVGLIMSDETRYMYENNTLTPLVPSVTGTTYTVQAFFMKTSGNRLKYDATDKYFYFEDGEYPQTYVGNSLNATLANTFTPATAVAEYYLNYFDGVDDVKVPVYLYNGVKYAMLTAEKTTTLTLNGTSVRVTEGDRYFFKVEPIKWRVSDYGVAADEYPSDWATYGTYKENFTVVSDKVLTVGAVTSQKAQEGWIWTGSKMFVNVGKDSSNANFTFAGAGNSSFEQFADAGTQTLVESFQMTSAGLKTVAEDELGAFSDLSAKASDFAAFLLGADGGDTVEYWTRSLGWDLLQGKSITASGSISSNWLETVLGVRFSYIMSDGVSLFG